MTIILLPCLRLRLPATNYCCCQEVKQNQKKKKKKNNMKKREKKERNKFNKCECK